LKVVGQGSDFRQGAWFVIRFQAKDSMTSSQQKAHSSGQGT